VVVMGAQIKSVDPMRVRAHFLCVFAKKEKTSVPHMTIALAVHYVYLMSFA
jgi:hypothetical protein